MKKETAIEWLISELNGYDEDCEIFQKAKAMEREQIEDAYKQGRFDEIDAMDDLSFNPVAERYYINKYKGGEQ